MRSTVEPVEGNKVKVAVQVDEAELEPAVEQAWKEIAKEVRLPGFRPGKAPRRLLEKQFGGEYARSEALRAALPDFYGQAIIEHDVDVIAPPDLDITEGEDEGPVSFEAIVETRPEVRVAGYDGLRVEVPRAEPAEDEIDEQIDRLRGQYAELEVVDRPAAESDYVTVDITGTQDGEEVDGLTADGYLYLIGSGMIAAEFDEHLTGASAGDRLEFDADPPDPDQDTVHFVVSVTDVKERVLPELRTDTRERLASTRRDQTRQAVRNNLGAELAKLVDIDAPESLVSGEMQARLQNLAQQLGASGIRLEDWMQITGRDPEAFSEELRGAAVEAVKVDLALRAVVVAEGLEATDAELEDEIAEMIGAMDLSIEDAVEQLRAAGQLSAVRSDIAKRKALEWLVEHSEIVDTDGEPVAAELLQPPTHEHEHDHDGHDHDH